MLSSALLAEWRLPLLIGHRKGGLRHLPANLVNHGVDLAPRRQIVGAPRRQTTWMRDIDPGQAVDGLIENPPGIAVRASSPSAAVAASLS